MPKCCEDKFGNGVEFIGGGEYAIEEFSNFGDVTDLTDEKELLAHFQDLKRLESCDPLAPIYRIGLNPIIPYNFGGRAYA